jgi:glycosyltransferase involved in cell wall biosynthesis
MKICHITTVHDRYDIRIFEKECLSTIEQGKSVTLIVNDNLDDEIINNVNIISLNQPYKNKVTRIFSKSLKEEAFRKASELNADIYHFHDPELLGVGLKLKKSGFRVIYDAHEDVPRQILAKEWIYRFLRKLISIGFEVYENYCSKQFDAVIVPTPHLKNRFDKLNNSVWMVCNFPSTKDILYSAEKYSIDNPSCYIGDLSYTRGIKQIAEATNIVGLKLHICGKFHSNNLEEEIMSKFGNVKYLGYLSRSEISNLLVNSSIGFVTLLNTPNDAMSYPIKLFEYMAAGIPVISSNFQVYMDIVEKNKCGICVDPLDVNAIVDAIRIILEDKKFANELRENGYQAVIKKYNWENESKKLNCCYSHVLIEGQL